MCHFCGVVYLIDLYRFIGILVRLAAIGWKPSFQYGADLITNYTFGLGLALRSDGFASREYGDIIKKPANRLAIQFAGNPESEKEGRETFSRGRL
ncbi:hypothetical protein GCM10025791_46720 [Halioxenophilus aromaticivorans]|uniref:Uncharacterized protein n=1 Tax=Halioxenophilus aromaticivorans TaxID=1306992 RepID=A0AAV3U951_9ALTE